MQILTTFDDNFLKMAKSFYYSCRHYNKKIPICANLLTTSKKSISFCQENDIEITAKELDTSLGSKPASRILKMLCANNISDEDTAAYMDIDIVFQGNISQIEDLNPNFIWTLSEREGHQTSLRTWKKHYFTEKTVEFARHAIPLLTDFSVEEILQSPVRNCGVIYSKGKLLKSLFKEAINYYYKLLEINKQSKKFSNSDQLCFVLAFHSLKDKIKELPIRFNRMPYHQSYDFKDYSSFSIPNNVVLHLNKCKNMGRELVGSWSKNKKPIPKIEVSTRLSIVVPIQTSSIAERALTKNLYSLAVSNKANIYRDEDIGYPIKNKLKKINEIRESIKYERAAYDIGLFFLVNDFLFMIDHGEHVGSRASWIIGKHTKHNELAAIFKEQMENDLDVSSSQIPIIPLSYGVKEPLIWLNQGKYHQMGLDKNKKYSVHFVGKIEHHRSHHIKQLQKIPNSKIEHRSNSKRMTFDEYMRDLASSHLVWCPFGNRPKTHREVEAMCCEIAIVMPNQNIKEQEDLIPDKHYIQIKNDDSNLIEKIEYYLEHDSERKEIARQGRLWYERNVSDSARAEYIYKNCIKTIRGKL